MATGPDFLQALQARGTQPAEQGVALPVDQASAGPSQELVAAMQQVNQIMEAMLEQEIPLDPNAAIGEVTLAGQFQTWAQNLAELTAGGQTLGQQQPGLQGSAPGATPQLPQPV